VGTTVSLSSRVNASEFPSPCAVSVATIVASVIGTPTIAPDTEPAAAWSERATALRRF
jgi:hypothetical protein